MKKSKLPGKLGRPRVFDLNSALDQALEVFWSHGYEGASLSDLTVAMGITRPSLYAAFGNKEELFRKALDRYEERSREMLTVLNGPSARAGIEALLMMTVNRQCGGAGGRGCLLVQGALSCSEDAEPVRSELACRRRRMESAVRERLARAVEEGELPRDTDPADLARYYATISQGLSVQSAGGALPEELLPVVRAAMRAWPANE